MASTPITRPFAETSPKSAFLADWLARRWDALFAGPGYFLMRDQTYLRRRIDAPSN